MHRIPANVVLIRHLIRRSAFRAITSPSTSFLSKSRSITTSSPFITQIKPQATISPIFRRFASNNVETEARESETESTPSSADSEDQSSIASAISFATESPSIYASETTESLTKNTTAAKDAVVDTASGVASAAGLAFAPREDRRENRPLNEYGDDRRSGPPTGRYGERRRDFGVGPELAKPSNTIYVGNLLFEVREEDLEREFDQFGRIEETTIAKDARNLSKGYVCLRREFST
jgi:nucleolin